MVKTRIRPVTELGMPKARVSIDPFNSNEQTPNESEKASSENRTTVVKQKHIEKYVRNPKGKPKL